MLRWSRFVLLVAAAALTLAACGTRTATTPDDTRISTSITYGELDGERHPMVGLMVAFVGDQPLWRCSGTLIAPTVFLTAGHCTEPPADRVEIWFDTDMRTDATNRGYPFTGEVGGEPHVHPDYDPDAFFQADVGVVVLDEPVDLAEYGTLPAPDQLDVLAKRRGRQDTTFTAVGYGVQRIDPVFVEAELVRMLATPRLVQINAPGLTGDFSMLLSNNAATGGTCFGDSGGPNFLGDSLVVAGVTSFGLNGNCAGTGGVYRLDRAAPLDWVKSFLD